jgi:type IV pilus assembly protein PilV
MLVKPMQPPVRQAERGASLVEVLVSILVISFGILAMAAVQSNSVRFQKTSEYRATANLLTSEMADRMRANASGVSADAYRWNPQATRP